MLRIENLHKSFGGVSALNDVNLHFQVGSLTAVIGPNGAGKTTFFNVVSGEFPPDRGRIMLDGEDIAGLSAPAIVRRGIGRAFQIANIFPTLTVRESILGTVNAHRGYFELGVKDFAHAEAEYRGWLSRLLTHPVDGLESFSEMMRQLTEEKQAVKVYVKVREME